MEQVSEESSFQIILHSDNEDDLSEYWQDQCWYLYDELFRTLPEGSIKPLALEDSPGEKAYKIALFSHAILNEITEKIFVEVLLEAIKKWHHYRPSAKIELKCPDGRIIKITNQSLPKLLKYFDEIRKKEYELEKKKLIENLGPQLPLIVLNESVTILTKYYEKSSPLGQVDATIFDYLESLLHEELLPEKRSDAIQNYIEVVQHLKGVSINDRQKKWKEEEAEQIQEERLEREIRDKDEQEKLRKQSGKELQRLREEEERKREKEFLERKQLEEQERKRKEEEKARKARKEAEEKAIKEKKDQERLHKQYEEAEKLEESKRKAQEEIQRLISEERVVELDPELSDSLFSKLPFKIDRIVEEQFSKLPEGLVKFIFNKKMKVDVSEKVEAYIAKNACQINEKIEQYYLSSEDKVSSLSRKVKITSRMRISLEGANFEIKPTTPSVQQILNNEATTWRWTVKPLKSGIQKLLLSVDIIITLPQDIDRERHITMLEEEIKVKVNPMYILECNWKWILGTMITIILAILFKG